MGTRNDSFCKERRVPMGPGSAVRAGSGPSSPSLGVGWASPWHGPRLRTEMLRPRRQAMVLSWHSLP